MSWSCGLVGLPNAGKSTLFKALTARRVLIESYPFSTVNPNKAVVSLDDQRLNALAALSNSTKVTPAGLEIIDVAGLVKGASEGEGLGNQFLGHLRQVDLLVHVVAGFSPDVGHGADPSTSIDTINLELCLADLDSTSRRRQKVAPRLKSGDRSAPGELGLLDRLEKHLSAGTPLRNLKFINEEKAILEELSLLTFKDMVYVYNLGEEMRTDTVPGYFDDPSLVIPLFARLEAEIADLPDTEKIAFLEAYGVKQSGVSKLLGLCCNRLNLITFYTIKGNEARAWSVPAGTKAVQAAGKIHTDMERGFVRAEIVPSSTLLNEGSLGRVRDKGLYRLEGRDYMVQDGDVLFVRFKQQ